MFGKKHRIKKAKLQIIGRIEKIQSALTSQGLGKVTYHLDTLTQKLDNEYLELSSDQISRINECLSKMESHINRAYEAYLLNKCNRIDAVLLNSYSVSKLSEAYIQNEDQLYEFVGDLTGIDNQIKDLTSKMDKVLGANEGLWNMYNGEKKQLLNRMATVNKNFQMLLTNQNNIAMAEDVKKAKEMADVILVQNGLVDVQEFVDNANYTNDVQNEINTTSSKMDEAFLNNFGGANDTYEYEKALEEKRLKEAGQQSSDPSKMTNH